jgi:hypothetical protein
MFTMQNDLGVWPEVGTYALWLVKRATRDKEELFPLGGLVDFKSYFCEFWEVSKKWAGLPVRSS